MRAASVASVLLLVVATTSGCARERPGLDLYVTGVPSAAARLEVTLDDDGAGRLAMGDGESGGVTIDTESGRVTLTFPSSFPGFASGAFHVLLVPSGAGAAFPVKLGGRLLHSDQRVIGGAATRDATIAPGARTAATLAFECTLDSCEPPAVPTNVVVDVEHPPASPGIKRYQGEARDGWIPLAIGRFGGADQPDRADLVLGVPTRSATVGGTSHPGSGVVYLFRGQSWSVPGFLSTAAAAGEADVTIVGRDGDGLGFAATLADFDGDGADDLVVTGRGAAQPGAPNNTAGAGVAYVIANTRLQLDGTIDLNDPRTWEATPRIYGAGSQDNLGWSVAAADLHDDRFVDLVLGAPGNGRVYLVRGFGPGGTTLVQTGPPGAGDQKATIVGSSLGRALAAGAIDRDAGDEVAVGAALDAGGVVWVVSGARLARDRVIDLGVDAQVDVAVRGFGTEQLGYAVAIADLGGERPELVTGSRLGNLVRVVPVAAALAAGTREIDLEQGGARVTVEGPGDVGFGSALAAGSLRAAGSRDLVIGAPGSGADPEERGAAYVVVESQLATAGSLLRLEQTPAQLAVKGAAGDRLGAYLAVGNLDTESTATVELAVGAPNGGEERQGIVYGIQGLR